MDGRAQPPPHSGWEAGGGLWAHKESSASWGEVTLSSPSGTPVWLTVSREATACLHVPAKTWVLRPLTQVSNGPCASQLCRGPPHWMLFPPDAVPSSGCSGPGAGQGDCGQVSCSLLHLHTTASLGGIAHFLCHGARWGHAGGALNTALCHGKARRRISEWGSHAPPWACPSSREPSSSRSPMGPCTRLLGTPTCRPPAWSVFPSVSRNGSPCHSSQW